MPSVSAKDSGVMLNNMGYKGTAVDANYKPRPGDVIVYQPKKLSPHGHIEIVGTNGKLYSDHADSRSVASKMNAELYSSAVVYRKGTPQPQQSNISVAQNTSAQPKRTVSATPKPVQSSTPTVTRGGARQNSGNLNRTTTTSSTARTGGARQNNIAIQQIVPPSTSESSFKIDPFV
jgi:hypothetical protein